MQLSAQALATEKTKSHVRAHGTLLGMVVRELRAHFHFPVVDVPQHPVKSEIDIEEVAEQTRLHWQLGLDAPIVQVGRALERAGIFIARHVVQTPKVDAFSPPGVTTIVFLNETVKSTSRWTFDLGHETGHLVMHRGIQTGDIETESQADRFASAFLMRRRPFAREFQAAPFSWPHIFALKRRWHTSLAAIVRRSYDLNLVGAAQYRRAYQCTSFKGWTKGEPADPPFQEPELLATAFAALGSRVDLTAYQLCQRLHFTARDVQSGNRSGMSSTCDEAFERNPDDQNKMTFSHYRLIPIPSSSISGTAGTEMGWMLADEAICWAASPKSSEV